MGVGEGNYNEVISTESMWERGKIFGGWIHYFQVYGRTVVDSPGLAAKYLKVHRDVVRR